MLYAYFDNIVIQYRDVVELDVKPDDFETFFNVLFAMCVPVSLPVFFYLLTPL